MNFGFTEEQELLRGEARKFLDQHAPIANVRKWVETPEGFSRELWAQMAELGWTGLLVPEEHGGVGLDLVTLLVVLEETGRTLCPSPLISNSLAARAIASSIDWSSRQTLLGTRLQSISRCRPLCTPTTMKKTR